MANLRDCIASIFGTNAGDVAEGNHTHNDKQDVLDTKVITTDVGYIPMDAVINLKNVSIPFEATEDSMLKRVSTNSKTYVYKDGTFDVLLDENMEEVGTLPKGTVGHIYGTDNGDYYVYYNTVDIHNNRNILDLLGADIDNKLTYNGVAVHRDADYKTIGIYPTVADLPTEAGIHDIALVGSISDYVGGGSSSLQHFLRVEKTDPDGNTHDVWEDIEYHRLPTDTHLGEIKAKIVTNADGGNDLYISIDGTDIDAQDA